MYPTSIKNDGNGESPLATLIANSMKIRAAASNGDYLSSKGRVLLALSNAAASVGDPLSSQKGDHGFVG
jgi:hypothetical protein